MANLLVLNGDSEDKYLKSSGAGTDLDPHIPEHKETSAVAILAAVDGIEALLTTIDGRVDTLETLITATNATLAAATPAGTNNIGDVDVLTMPTVTANPTSRAAAAANVNVPASNTAAVITYAAGGSGVAHAIRGVAWSYSGAPTAGNLKIEDGSGTTVFSIDITAAGPGFIPFASPLKGTANTAMIITLAAGGSGISGKVNALGKWTE